MAHLVLKMALLSVQLAEQGLSALMLQLLAPIAPKDISRRLCGRHFVKLVLEGGLIATEVRLQQRHAPHVAKALTVLEQLQLVWLVKLARMPRQKAS